MYSKENFNSYVNEDAYYYVVSDRYACHIAEYIKVSKIVHILRTSDNHYWKYEDKTDKWYEVIKIGESSYRLKKYSRSRKNYLNFGKSTTYLDPNF